MKKNLLHGVMLMITILIFGCSKQEGCTDNKATNFDTAAEKDCNCCTYEGNVVFYYNKDVADDLAANGVVSLTYYVDNAIVGSSAANVYWNGIPACGQAASITVTKKLGESKSKAYEYRIVDEDGIVQWEGVANWEANTCLKLHLTP